MQPESGGLSGGAIAGIVVGAIVGIGIVIVVCLLVFLYARRRRPTRLSDNNLKAKIPENVATRTEGPMLASDDQLPEYQGTQDVAPRRVSYI